MRKHIILAEQKYAYVVTGETVRAAISLPHLK